MSTMTRDEILTEYRQEHYSPDLHGGDWYLDQPDGDKGSFIVSAMQNADDDLWAPIEANLAPLMDGRLSFKAANEFLAAFRAIMLAEVTREVELQHEHEQRGFKW